MYGSRDGADSSSDNEGSEAKADWGALFDATSLEGVAAVDMSASHDGPASMQAGVAGLDRSARPLEGKHEQRQRSLKEDRDR